MLKRLRSVVFWAHLIIGVSAAAIVLVMALTGVLLTYQRQIQAWADTRGLDGAAPSTSATQLPPDTLLAKVESAGSGRVTGLRWRRDPAAPAEVLYGRETTVFVNAYTGAVLGDGSERTRAFFRSVTDWHRWLALSGDDRARGRAITGVANLAFLFIVLAGFILWWPRNLTRRSLRSVVMFRRGLSGKARDFNWHNVIGIWSFLPLVIIVVSGAVISYAWAGGILERLTAEDGSARTAVAAPVAPDAAAGLLLAGDTADTSLLVEVARAQMPAWRSVTMHLPSRSGRVRFTLDGGTGGQPQYQAELSLSPTTGEVLDWQPFSSGSRPQRVRSILRFAHTGEALGLVGQTIAGAASAGAVLLVWTGIALALRRLRSWLRRRHSRDSPGPAAADRASRRTP
ncbi:MAG TPA: PepSY-associated TM helix domain-containing protein [Longimicrobiales bacterium]|nr:PepSY-associated TM helix domain-containing protein [Longimicrobiales bacterium]